MKHSSSPTGKDVLVETSVVAGTSRTQLMVERLPNPTLRGESSFVVNLRDDSLSLSSEDLEAGIADVDTQENQPGILVRTDVMLTRSS